MAEFRVPLIRFPSELYLGDIGFRAFGLKDDMCPKWFRVQGLGFRFNYLRRIRTV